MPSFECGNIGEGKILKVEIKIINLNQNPYFAYNFDRILLPLTSSIHSSPSSSSIPHRKEAETGWGGRSRSRKEEEDGGGAGISGEIHIESFLGFKW